MPKWLYIPLDVKVREIHCKTLLAAAAAQLGYHVMIGRKKELDRKMQFSPPGFYLGLGAQKNFYQLYKDLKSKGHKISAMDEEGLVTFNEAIYKKLRVSPDTLKETDVFFTWGEYQSGVIASASNGDTMPQIKPVGNLRLDTLRPELRELWKNDITKIKAKYGRYILVVSSFGSANHFDGNEKYFQSLKDKKIIQTAEDEKIYRNYIEWKAQCLKEFLAVIPELAIQHPDINFVVRPHPSESHDTWLSISKVAPNIVMESGNSIQPWILGSELVLHHFCTTAVEAYLADIPAIAFRPFIQDSIESAVPYACSAEAFTRDDLFEDIKNMLQGDVSELQTKREEAKDFYSDIIDVELPAFQKMLAEYERQIPRSVNLKKYMSLWLGALKDRFAKKPKSSAYLKHKFPDFTQDELNSILKVIAPMVGLKSYKTKKLIDNCFVVTRK